MRVTVIGCGIVGALTAYELSHNPKFEITVLDRQGPGQGATQAALGLLMGVISHRRKGRRWQRCWQGLERYERLIPELRATTGQAIAFNQRGLLRLCFEGEDLGGWRSLMAHRAQQGLTLEWLDRSALQARYPQVQHPQVCGAIYSPRDRQLDPYALTQALVSAAQQRGVKFVFDSAVLGFDRRPLADGSYRCEAVRGEQGSWRTDAVVVTAGLGATGLTQALDSPLELRPVLGQALQVRLSQPLGGDGQAPVITGQDLHIAPLQTEASGSTDYWIGATVELADAQGHPPALHRAPLEATWQKAMRFCPDLAPAQELRSWSGLRPRPEGRPAPVLEQLTGHVNVLLATGHYRNGVLLAPASAQWVRQALETLVGA